MWERGELFLPALVVSESLKPPESVEVPGQGLVCVTSRSPGALPMSQVWPRSVSDASAVLTPWNVAALPGASKTSLVAGTRSVQPGHGERESTERGSCVGFVLSPGSSSHSMGSAVVLLLNQISWAVGGKGKWENACGSGGQHLQGCCASPGGCWQCICSTKTGSKEGYK